MSGGPCGWIPAAVIPSTIRGAKASKSARDSQKSVIPHPPSIGPEAWKRSPFGGVRSGFAWSCTWSNCSWLIPANSMRIPTATANPLSIESTTPHDESRTCQSRVSRARSATGDEDVLSAVVVQRLPGESAVERFEAQARDVEESKPFVLCCPPQRTCSTLLQGDVDPVVADAVVDRVRQRHSGVRVDMVTVDGGCDLVVEGERIPGEPPVGSKRSGDALEATAAIRPRGQMQQRPAGTVDQGRRLVDLEVGYVPFPEVDLDSLLGRVQPCLREHPRRRVDPDHGPARCLSDRDRDSPGTDGELDQWPVSLEGKSDVEGNVGPDARGAILVSVRPRVVPTRHRTQRTRRGSRRSARPVTPRPPRTTARV